MHKRIIMKHISTVLIVSILLTGCKSEQQIESSSNPVFEGWYADPEIAIYNDTFWIFPTYSNRFKKQVFVDAYSSPNLLDWKKHTKIIDTSVVKWAKEALWAPSSIKKDGKYFLFFSANDIQDPVSPYWNAEKNIIGEIGGIGIGVSDKPEGPYTDYLKKPLINEFYNKAQPIDQFVFQDKTGQYLMIYGGWGHCNIVKLNNDFTGLEPFSDGEIAKEITPEGFVEGAVMFYRKNKLYFMWSEGEWTDSSYQVAYSIGETPFGPFKRMGTVLKSNPEIATGAGHHSILNIPDTDEWYIVYHRRPIPNSDRDHRVTCIDRMYFNEDGTIKSVDMTFKGVKKVK